MNREEVIRGGGWGKEGRVRTFQMKRAIRFGGALPDRTEQGAELPLGADYLRRHSKQGNPEKKGVIWGKVSRDSNLLQGTDKM